MLPLGAQADEHEKEMVICEADGSEVEAAEMCPPTLGERVITLEQRNQDVVLYGKIHNRIAFDDPANPASDSTTDVESSGSRIGIRAQSALGNGLTAHGHYEFNIVTDTGTDNTFTRQGYVGLSGGFGKVTVGQQSTAFYNMTGGTMDPTNFVGPVGGSGEARSANTIKYSNAIGPLALEVDLRTNDQDSKVGGWKGDGAGAGVKIAVTDGVTLGAAFNVEDQTDNMNEDADGVKALGDESTYSGVSAKVAFGNLWGSVGWTNEEVETAAGAAKSDTDYIAAYFGASFNESTSGFIGYSNSDDGTKEPSKIMVNVVHNLGGGLSVSYEGASEDTDTAGEDNHIEHVFGIEYNF